MERERNDEKGMSRDDRHTKGKAVVWVWMFEAGKDGNMQ